MGELVVLLVVFFAFARLAIRFADHLDRSMIDARVRRAAAALDEGLSRARLQMRAIDRATNHVLGDVGRTAGSPSRTP